MPHWNIPGWVDYVCIQRAGPAAITTGWYTWPAFSQLTFFCDWFPIWNIFVCGGGWGFIRQSETQRLWPRAPCALLLQCFVQGGGENSVAVASFAGSRKIRSTFWQKITGKKSRKKVESQVTNVYAPPMYYLVTRYDTDRKTRHIWVVSSQYYYII